MKFRPSLESLDGRIVPDATPVAPPSADVPDASEIMSNPVSMVTLLQPGSDTPVTMPLAQVIALVEANNVANPAAGTEGLMLELGILQALNGSLTQELQENGAAIKALLKQGVVITGKIDALLTKLENENDPTARAALQAEIAKLQADRAAVLQSINVLANRNLEIIAAIRANNARINEILQQLGFGQVKVSLVDADTQPVEA